MSMDTRHTYSLALRHYRAGQHDSALNACNAVLSVNADSPEILHLTGLIFYKNGDYVKAEQLITRAVEIKPDYAEAINNLALFAKQRGELDRSITLSKRALALDPSDVQAILNFAITMQETGRLDDAIRHFNHVLVLKPQFAQAHYHLGQIYDVQGNAEEAISNYHKALEIQPGYPAVLASLGVALYRHGDIKAALPVLREAAARSTNGAIAIINLGIVLQECGQTDEAKMVFSNGLKLYPNNVILLTGLASVINTDGRTNEAFDLLDQALKINPACVEALAMRASIAFTVGDMARSIADYEEALRITPDRPDLHIKLYAVSQVAGNLPNALDHLEKALAIKQLYYEPCVTGVPSQSVLILMAPGSWQANVPTDFLFDNKHYTIYRYFLTKTSAIMTDLPPADIVFNAVAEADSAKEALDRAEALLASCHLPVINHPYWIRRTTRDAVASLLKDLPGCLCPPVYRINREDLNHKSIIKFLQEHSLKLPCIVRPIGSHAGDDLAKIDQQEQLITYLESTTATDFYISPYIDYRNDDGYFRKYRIMFVDGEAFPYHLAISSHWKIHYYSSDMQSEDWMRHEEECFLDDFGSRFPPVLQNVLAEIPKRIGLDYFGIDCAITNDKKLLVFEVNAAMLVHLRDDPQLFSYKYTAVPKIFQAVDKLLTHRATSGSIKNARKIS